MESFIKDPTKEEQQVLEDYVSQVSILHVGATVWSYVTSITFIIGPFFMDQPFPTNAVYPFPTENFYLKILIYIQQSLVGLQTSAAVLLDSLIATLLWFLCARFEQLAMNIDQYNNFEELKYRVKQYKNLLRYYINNKTKKYITQIMLD